MGRVIANAQAGLNGLEWLRNAGAVEGNFSGYARHGEVFLAMLALARTIAQQAPTLSVEEFYPKILARGLDYIGSGAEAIVIREGDSVAKYLAGKTQNPHKLVERIEDRHLTSGQYLGKHFLPSVVSVERAKLFRGLPAEDYVCIRQPFIDIHHFDPQKDPIILAEEPEIANTARSLADSLIELFSDTGLLMDVTNDGNVVWGTLPNSTEPGLYLIDSLAVHINEKDFIGKKVPFWDPVIHLESLAEFMNTVFTEEELSERFSTLDYRA